MRLRREPKPTPEVTRELEALDAALAGRPVAPEHAELTALAVALRDEAPRPRPEFALDLDLRARDGFPRPEAAPRLPRKRVPRRRWGLALGAAASVFIALTAVVSSGLLDSGGKTDAGRGEPAPMPMLAKPQDQAAGREAAPAPSTLAVPESSPLVSGEQQRKVARTVTLTLAAPRDEIEDTADRAIEVTDRHGGFVMNSRVSGGEGPDVGALLELRIPSRTLPAALADLSELGHVRSRTQGSRDITAAFRSPRRRLADALAERRGLLRQLARAATPNETAAVRARLRAVNRRIDRAQAQLRALRNRVAFTPVSVTIEPGGAARADAGGWTLGDALDDALGVLRALLGAALVALAVLIPAAILGGLGWLAYRASLRRRRDRALEM
jgi:Domain of unknown function (DUF4349)